MIHEHPSRSPESLVRDAIARWREGEQPDAQRVLEAHPEIRERKTLAIDLIYEEFCLRQEQGETFVASTFMKRFPAYKQSLARMLDVHQFLAAAPAATPTWPQAGDVFLGFEIVEQIGAGAVAKVYLAREVEVGGRPVVIKVSQFGRGEARLLGKVSHPGVVPIHSVREDPLSGMTCICMPFLGTATLVDLLDQAFALGAPPASAQVVAQVAPGYLPPEIDASSWQPVDPFYRTASYEEGIVHLGRQIVAALAKAHEAGITHRDIKPSNVLLSRDGRPMLLDFNLSTDERMPAERIGGTLAYMAPERIESLAANVAETETDIDPRSDLYSVGAMLFELLTGQLPSRPPEVAGQRQPALDQWIECRRTAPPSARALNGRVEPGLDAILNRALAPRPEDRYAAAEQLLASLEALLHPRARLARTIRRRRRFILAAGLGAAALGLSGGAYWLSLPPLPVRLYESGLAAYDRKDYLTAKKRFTEAIDAGNDSADVYFARGQTHRQLKDAAQNSDFAMAQQRDKSGVVAIYVAFAASESGMGDLAIPLFQSAQSQGWDVPSVANHLAITFVQKRQFLNGIREFDRILASFGDKDDIRFNRAFAWVYYCRNQPNVIPDPESLEHMRSLRNKFPNDLQVRNLAVLLSSAAEKNFLPRQNPDEILPLNSLNWRKMPPPLSPRLADCRKALQSEERLP